MFLIHSGEANVVALRRGLGQEEGMRIPTSTPRQGRGHARFRCCRRCLLAGGLFGQILLSMARGASSVNRGTEGRYSICS